jgi:protein toll
MSQSLDGPSDISRRMVVVDAKEVRCEGTGQRVADWDTSDCSVFNYLPIVVTLGSVLGLSLVLGPLLYINRLKAMVALHATLNIRPFTRQHFNEDDFSHETLVVHGPSDKGLQWVSGTLLPKMESSRHRLCIPERDFLIGGSTAESYATAVEHAKSTVLLMYDEALADEWWLYAFQLARAQNARRPHIKMLLVLMEDVDENRLEEDVREFIKSHTYLRLDDKWFWKKLFFYLPDPPKVCN